MMKIPVKLRMPWSAYPHDQQVLVSQEFMRRFLKTDDGKVFFSVFLKDHFYFDPPKTQEEQGLRNYATYFISERLGLHDLADIASAILDSTP